MTEDRFHPLDTPHPTDPDTEPQEEGEGPRPTASRWTDSIRNRLFQARTLIISGEVNQKLAAEVMGQLLAMSSESEEPITIFINSQGGHVESGDTIHDIIRFVRAPVRMVGTGWVASAGALIYVAVPQERRYSLPNTRFLLHQPAGGTRGTAADVEIEAREILKMRERLNRVFAEQTGQPLERIVDDTHRNFWLGADDAVEYGLVGKIIQHVNELD
ncbi:MAG TPA: ATP-dependent Clp protease proteolytic subunit [Longimicrobiales bacterium]|nr:ATP-dependent Clp protease proteolytic subunit [Longimicrobiales bacterium]